jgi:hypothetical protein
MNWPSAFTGQHDGLMWIALLLIVAGLVLALAAAVWQLGRWVRGWLPSDRSAAPYRQKMPGSPAARRQTPADQNAARVSAETAISAFKGKAKPGRSVSAAGGSYRQTAPAVAAAAPSAALDGALLRLRHVAESLEQLHRQVLADADDGVESALKPPTGQVEYVFKASRT